MGCSNRSWTSMWLHWSFNQASHCWLYGTFESSGSTQPHCRKGGLTLVTAAGTAQPSQAQLCLSRCHVLPSVPAGKLCWTLSPPELAGARCSSGVSGLICWLSLTSPALRCPGWVNYSSTHRTTPLDLSEGLSHPQWNYPPCYFPSHHDTSFPWRNEGIHSEWQISLPSLNWPSTASSAPLSKVPSGDRQTICECQ